MSTLLSGCLVCRFGVFETHASCLRGFIASILCGDAGLLCHGVLVTSSNLLLKASHVSWQLHPLVFFSDWRVACMLSFMARPFSTLLLDVLSSSCISSRSVMMLPMTFLALSSFCPTLSFALSTWVIYLKALSA